MNPLLADTPAALARDAQPEPDTRRITIDQVGIRGLCHALVIATADGSQPTIATWEFTVRLSAEQRGTHMRRFVETLEAWSDRPVDGESLRSLLAELGERLETDHVHACCSFTLVFERHAPVSGLSAGHGIDCTLTRSHSPSGASLTLGGRVPVTTLCPCSKEISEYGAHNQRGYVTITARTLSGGRLDLEDLIAIAEQSGSAVIYPLLKRADERHVTMQAYDTPTFVEDIVRGGAVALIADERVLAFEVEAESHESVHDHAAVATVRWERT